MPAMPFKPASRALSFFLRKLGFVAAAMPNGRAYFLVEHLHDRDMRWHELCHLRQMQRIGWTFWPRYYLEMIRNGYGGNKFEIEANAFRASRCSRKPVRLPRDA